MLTIRQRVFSQVKCHVILNVFFFSLDDQSKLDCKLKLEELKRCVVRRFNVFLAVCAKCSI